MMSLCTMPWHMEMCDKACWSADEGDEGDGLLLTRADESIEKRKRRINQLLQEIPEVLKAAEEKEAHAAKVKASQAELPSPPKVHLLLTPFQLEACTC